MRALWQKYPRLESVLPHLPLGDFPTPVLHLKELGAAVGVQRLYMKHDGVSATGYGGNKVRKLELILAEARRRGAEQVLTFGFAGSNHAAATAFFAREAGLSSISMLLPQPNAAYVGRNLLTSHAAGAALHLRRGEVSLGAATIAVMARRLAATGKLPMLVPPGGSSPLGTIGFVAAAFEIAAQVAEGELPAPDRLYVALGSAGTAAGLALGLKAARLPCRVMAVRVAEEKHVNAKKLRRLYARTNRLLRSLDRSFPDLPLTAADLEIRDGMQSSRYGEFTEPGMRAVELMGRLEGVALDGTYTGKTLAVLLADAAEGALRDGVTVFWNTYNARDLSSRAPDIDYHDLPAGFHTYFETPYQALDPLRSGAK